MTDDLPLAGTRVLVVEDDFYLASDACDSLSRAGASVVGPAPSVEEAHRLIEAGGVDRAVVDINLGSGPSFEIADRLARDAVPFVFTTGYDEGAIPAKHRQTPRLEKPFVSQLLIKALQSLR